MSPEEEEARDRLLFHLENQTGFWFALVVSDDARPRARLCEAAEAWCKEHGRAFTLHEPRPDGLVTLAVELASGDSPGVHWIRADGVKSVIDAWNGGAAQMLMAMNERREAYRKRLDGGIVVEGRTSLKRLLREMAPDLFSIRAFIAEPGEDTKGKESDFPEWRPPGSLTSLISGKHVDPELALARLARLSALESTAEAKGWVDAEGLAMTSLFNAGRYDEAERHARELLSKKVEGAEPATDFRQEIPAYDILARIAILRNRNVQEAIRLWDRALAQASEHSSIWQGLDLMERLYDSFVLMQIRQRRAKALVLTGDLEAARTALEELASAFSGIAGALPPEMQIDLVDCYLRLGDVLERKGELKAAERILQKAVSLAEECAARRPEDQRWQLEVLQARSELGSIQLEKQDMGSALKTLIPIAALAERLEEHALADAHWRGVLEMYHATIAFILSYQINYSKESDEIRQRALFSLKRQIERQSDKLTLAWWLARFHLHRAELLESQDAAGARESARQALELVKKLPVRSTEDADLKNKIESLRAFVRPTPKKRARKKR